MTQTIEPLSPQEHRHLQHELASLSYPTMFIVFRALVENEELNGRDVGNLCTDVLRLAQVFSLLLRFYTVWNMSVGVRVALALLYPVTLCVLVWSAWKIYSLSTLLAACPQ
jgi:hypothetical protein